MALIKSDILKELKKEAITYLKTNKGKSISKDDITVAENLMVFGYVRGLEEILNKKELGNKNQEAFELM